MWDLRQLFKKRSSLVSLHFWPAMTRAVLLHLAVIGGYIWQASLKKQAIKLEEVELVFLPAALPMRTEVTPKEEERIPAPRKKKEKFSSIAAPPPFKPSVSPSLNNNLASLTKGEKLVLKKGNPNPPYPEEARQQGIEGKVTILITIYPNGAVQDVQVISNSPPCLVASVLETVKEWSFYLPGQMNGYQETFHFNFLLEQE